MSEENGTTIGRPIQVQITIAGIAMPVTLYVDYAYERWGIPDDADWLRLTRIMTIPVAERATERPGGPRFNAPYTLMDDARDIDRCDEFDAATGRDHDFPEDLEQSLTQTIIAAGVDWEKPTE